MFVVALSVFTDTAWFGGRQRFPSGRRTFGETAWKKAVDECGTRLLIEKQSFSNPPSRQMTHLEGIARSKNIRHNTRGKHLHVKLAYAVIMYSFIYKAFHNSICLLKNQARRAGPLHASTTTGTYLVSGVLKTKDNI